MNHRKSNEHALTISSNFNTKQQNLDAEDAALDDDESPLAYNQQDDEKPVPFESFENKNGFFNRQLLKQNPTN